MNLKDLFSSIKDVLFMMAVESYLTLVLAQVNAFENLIPYYFDSNLNLKREIFN